MNLSLNDDETNKLDDYWKFIEIFNKIASNSSSVYDFRQNIIKKIQKKYSPTEFYFFERILNKLLWTLLYKYKIEISKTDMNTKLAMSIQNGSCINKQIIINDDKYFIFPSYKEINKLSENLCKILYILSDRNLYNKIIDDSEYIKKIKDVKMFYYPLDYPFPNINLMYYNDNDKKIWLKRIRAYYYYKDDSKWYKLISL